MPSNPDNGANEPARGKLSQSSRLKSAELSALASIERVLNANRSEVESFLANRSNGFKGLRITGTTVF